MNRLANMAVVLQCLLPAGWLPPLRPPTARPASDDLEGPAAGGDEQRRLLPPEDQQSDQQLYRSAPQLVVS